MEERRAEEEEEPFFLRRLHEGLGKSARRWLACWCSAMSWPESSTRRDEAVERWPDEADVVRLAAGSLRAQAEANGDSEDV